MAGSQSQSDLPDQGQSSGLVKAMHRNGEEAQEVRERHDPFLPCCIVQEQVERSSRPKPVLNDVRKSMQRGGGAGFWMQVLP